MKPSWTPNDSQLGATTDGSPAVWRSLYWAAAICGALAVVTVQIDLQVTRFFQQQSLPGDLRKLISLSETFAHGLGAAVILIAVWVLDPARRASFPRLLLTCFGSGMAANTLKLITARLRPAAFTEQVQELAQAEVAETFVGWLPLLSAGPAAEWDHRFQSMPSGHTATAIGLAVGLTLLYPRGRHLFALLAGLAMLQRITSLSHWLSDTMAGAAVAFLWCAVLADPKFGGRQLARLEALLKRRYQDGSEPPERSGSQAA